MVKKKKRNGFSINLFKSDFSVLSVDCSNFFFHSDKITQGFKIVFEAWGLGVWIYG